MKEVHTQYSYTYTYTYTYTYRYTGIGMRSAMKQAKQQDEGFRLADPRSSLRLCHQSLQSARSA
jgi:hypothetical protein